MWQVRKILLVLSVIISLLVLLGGNVFAQNCDNRFLTLVNPVRGRNLWFDKSLVPLKNQYEEIIKYEYSGTWLLQYDAIVDQELVSELKKFDEKQELGLFLEVSPTFAKDSRVIYPHAVVWDDPNAIFLSGYSQSERKKLIDTLFGEFKETFGRYPKSVGAWWIDSYSLSYMDKKYDIDTVLIVADQKTTDDYGVWGQWWGVPYRPRKENILIPADNKKDTADYVVIQWAQRDVTRAYGDGPSYSNYSLQANDYIERGLDTKYFLDLTSKYLDCGSSLGQVTVGLETGIESVKSFPEYQNQLIALNTFENLQSVFMSEFGQKYMEKYSINPPEIILKDKEGEWEMTSKERKNDLLSERITYQTGLSFSDYFVADKNKFLDRRLPINKSLANDMKYPIFGVFAFLIGFFLFQKRKILEYYLPVSLFVLAFLLPLFKSFSANGWHVFFGPVVDSIPAYQFFVSLAIFLSFALMVPLIKKQKRINLFFWLLPFSFSIDFIILVLRYTKISGLVHLGVMLDSLKFVGITYNGGIDFAVKDLPSVVAGSLLQIRPEVVWNNNFYSFFIYPLTHMIFAFILYKFFLRLPNRLVKFVVIAMSVFFIFYINWIFKLDPRIVN